LKTNGPSKGHRFVRYAEAPCKVHGINDGSYDTTSWNLQLLNKFNIKRENIQYSKGEV